MIVSKRKQEHIEISLNHDIGFLGKTSGFEAYDFIHCALPELNYSELDTSTTFLEKSIDFPLLISPMTGGFSGAMEINRDLAEVCQKMNVPFSVGSQRQILENHDHHKTFEIVRQVAPDIIIIGNIGAPQIVHQPDINAIIKMIDLIRADAIAVHLNPLQELLQPEGNTDFTGVLKGIKNMVTELPVPVIVKEIGCGISAEVASMLSDVGVMYIDVAGAGGTSWAAIESIRNGKQALGEKFRDWGIPTANCIIDAAKIPDAKIIASGGVDNGITIAKAIALGAQICGSALPVLKAWTAGKTKHVEILLKSWQEELKMVMFLTGCKTIKDLQNKNILIKKNV